MHDDVMCLLHFSTNNNNNKHFFNLQVANSPSRLRFEANLSRESSECTEHSQDQTSQINTGKTVVIIVQLHLILLLTNFSLLVLINHTTTGTFLM